jgi:hypothetical protein
MGQLQSPEGEFMELEVIVFGCSRVCLVHSLLTALADLLDHAPRVFFAFHYLARRRPAHLGSTVAPLAQLQTVHAFYALQVHFVLSLALPPQRSAAVCLLVRAQG